MKHIPSFDAFLNEDVTINEKASEIYFDLDWNRKNEKQIYDYKNKIMDMAEKSMPVLAKVLEEVYPGVFDIDGLGFKFSGNAAFVYANIVDKKYRFGLDYYKIEENSEFKKFFDLAGPNLDSSTQRTYTSYFRLKT
jgi:hypothetical protein